MRRVIRAMSIAAVALQASAAFAMLFAQSTPGQARPGGKAAAPHACSLLTTADFEKITGKPPFGDEATPASLFGGAGSSCTFANGQIILLSGDKAEANWNALVKNYGHENAPKHPVPGVGDRAYAFFPKPRDEYEETNAFVVVKVGPHVVAVSAVAAEGEPAESVQPHALALAKIAVARLR